VNLEPKLYETARAQPAEPAAPRRQGRKQSMMAVAFITMLMALVAFIAFATVAMLPELAGRDEQRTVDGSLRISHDRRAEDHRGR